MLRTLLTAKIHRARVTGADVHYIGSISIAQDLLDAAGILPGSLYHHFDSKEAILVELMHRYHADLDQIGEQLNGAAARLVAANDLVIIMAYGQFEDAEACRWQPTVVMVDHDNRVTEVRQGVEGGVWADG